MDSSKRGTEMIRTKKCNGKKTSAGIEEICTVPIPS